MRRRCLLLPILTAGAVACGGPPTTPILEPDGARAAAPESGQASTRSGQPPVGDFRTNPPAGGDGIVNLVAGHPLRLNAGHFTDPEGDGLVLKADWGDGERGRAACGPCRLEHEYRPGVYTLSATIDDGTNQVSRTFRVNASQRCTTVYSASGSGVDFTFGPSSVVLLAGDEITASINGPGQDVEIGIRANGRYYLASVELNDFFLFRDSVTFSVVASVDGIGAAEFNGYGGLPYDWTLKVIRCGDSAE